MKNQMKIITDNEWDGKYELLEKQYKLDHLENIISLGDNIPTGKQETTGKDSYFKTKIKEIALITPSILELTLDKQLDIFFERYKDGFLERYGAAPDIIRKSTEFLKNSDLPVIKAITGNREYDYQIVLDFLAKKGYSDQLNYLEALHGTGKFELITEPKLDIYDLDAILFLPYTKQVETAKTKLSEIGTLLGKHKPRKLAIMTHENPAPHMFEVKRKVKNQQLLEHTADMATLLSGQTVMFTGHLDISAESAPYKGVWVQPLSSTETANLNLSTLDYNIKKLG